RERGPMISYEVRSIEIPGLAFRTRFDLDFMTDPPMGVAFLSDLEATLLLESLEQIPGASVVQAPRVSSQPAGWAVISDGQDIASLAPRPPIGPAADDLPPVDAAGRKPADRPAEGWVVQLRGRPADDERSIAMDIAIRDVHVVEVHTLDDPGLDRDQ